MGIDTTMLSIYRIPDIKVDAGTDWIALAGIILTAFTVVVGAWATNRNFKNTIRSQERLAGENALALEVRSKAEALARNRQDWINKFRIAISDFLAAAMELQVINIIMMTSDGMGGLSSEEAIEKARLRREVISRHSAKKGDARRYMAQIELYINPAELNSKRLIETIKAAYHAADNSGNLFALSDDVVSLSQIIIKVEWERVKQMT